MFYKEDIIRLGKEITELNIKLGSLKRELEEKTTISTPLGGFITWWQDNVLVKDVVRDIAKNMGYKIVHRKKEEVNTYIEKKKIKRKKVKK